VKHLGERKKKRKKERKKERKKTTYKIIAVKNCLRLVKKDYKKFFN